jgi:hypothetical protein
MFLPPNCAQRTCFQQFPGNAADSVPSNTRHRFRGGLATFQEPSLPLARRPDNKRYRALVLSSISPSSQWIAHRTSCSLRTGYTPSGARMRRFVRWSFLALLACAALAGGASATTYYVSTGGSDSNDGMSKTSSWAHLPGMQTWSGSHTPTTGDTFILRGCDNWGNANLPITWTWRGSGGNPITIDRDTTWYNTANCPSSWNRPIFDAGQAVMAGTECAGNNSFIDVTTGAATYTNWNWIELKNFYNNNGTCGKEFWIWITSGGDYVTFNNFYIHASFSGPSSSDIDNMIGVAATGMCTHCLVDRAVIDNSDGTKYTGGGVQFPMTHSVCSYVSNCVKPVIAGEFAYNNISHVGAAIGGVHPNCIETVVNGTNTFYIHDNIVHDMTGPGESCESLQIGNIGETDYVWNNVFYNLGGANGPDIPQSCHTGVAALYMFNNTFVVPSRAAAVSFNGCAGTSWTNAFVMSNNHCIQASATGGSTQSQGCLLGGTISGATTISFQDNLSMTQATAASDGYTNTQTAAYSPTSSSAPTVGTGANLTSIFWPAGFSTNDTTYACNEQTINGVVQSVCPERVSNGRPSSGAWSIGAYQFGASSGSALNPPSGLTAVVQ